MGIAAKLNESSPVFLEDLLSFLINYGKAKAAL
jgi:hypothetical protein